MDMKYDRKFEEMKKYIPFLENMITRLESTTTSSSNPRQAQLDKIRSLRDLLSNKKKRMKMENLLKCEQVLINLYAKVEQRDTLSAVKKADSGFSIESPTPKEKSDLEAVRNKLKTVAKRQESVQDTLPEILPRNEIDVGTSGTKEPALFQRRPNQQPSQMNNEENTTSVPGSTTKRNYTRVLVSPDTSARRWSKSPTPAEKPLFSRRSPRKSPRRYSPSYYKKERKKSQSGKRKDLNITLNVPEESLQSLNTKDILSRIINCSDGDVDIDTLRELRKQILTELQKTGAKDDISDLILKSYNKNKTKIKKSKKKVKQEIEEGELSDSESEAIESIYGSLVVKEPVQNKVFADKDTEPRKIQICLVINSDDNPETKSKEIKKQDSTDFAELVMYEKETTVENKCSVDKGHMNTDVNVAKEKPTVNENVKNDVNGSENKEISKDSVAKDNTTAAKDNTTAPKNNTTAPSDNTTASKDNTTALTDNTTASKNNEVTSMPETNIITLTSENDTITTKESIQFKANFYKPLTEPIHAEQPVCMNNKETSCNQTNDSQNKATTAMSNIESTLEQMEKSPEIPLLHDRTIEQKPPDSTLSEIDILQALKNEILSDITMPGTETTTPLLHQPKVIKVASAQEILPKKRISIEKYKQKSATASKSNLDRISPKEDSIKKTKVVSSLKLTDKECERFNIPNISFDDEDESLDDDDDGDILVSDLYSDLAPKSPDHDDSRHVESTPPVIIPVEPVKAVPAINPKVDVDMRTLPLSKIPSLYNNVTMSTNKDMCVDTKNNDKIKHIASQSRPTLIDPRIKRDLNSSINNQSPNPHVGNPERTPRHNAFTGIASNSIPNAMMTPNARTYEMTPTHQSFEIDQLSHNHKHVYVPTLTNFDFRESEKSVSREPGPGDRRSRMEDVREQCWNSRDSLSQSTRYNDTSNGSSKNDGSVTSTQSFARLEAPMTSLSYGRVDCPPTPNHPFGRLECPPTPNHPFGRLECPPTPSHYFGRTDCPPTPTHPFGRTDCPPTPSHPFGRSDCPPTPSHSFGRSDCPTTPSHPFGRSECPSTPSHPFGRSECPSTPSHSFGRSECPSTPSHPFGRTDAPPPLMLGLMDCSQFVGNDCSSTPTIFGRNECPLKSNRTYINSDCAPTPNSFGIIDSPQTPSHPFSRGEPIKNSYSRSDFTQKYPKDPRLYRKPESESNSQYDERDRGYYKDRDRYRGSSYSSQKSYSGSDSYSNYEKDHSTGRNSKYKYYAPEFRANKDHERQDRDSRRATSKDYEGDSAHNKERRYNSDVRNYEEVGVKRTRPEDIRPSSRAHSVGRTLVKGPEHRSLSVKSNAGRSFTIDTSIDSTFQKHMDRAKDILGLVNSFDARRERAASVGRSLARESSVGRTLSQISKPKGDAYENKREAFRRASSVGREMFESDKRSFQEIKADFKSCKFSEKEFINKYNEMSYYKSKDVSVPNERSRKDIHERQRTEKRAQELSKSSYSPRKNYRDPRMRRQLDNRNDRRGYDAHGRKSGIVYSNDNIVTGSIMASGYGVKNYKIPKIKRVTEEKEVVVANIEQDIKNDKESDKKKINDKIKEKLSEKEKVNVKEQEKVKNKNKEVLKEQPIEIGIASSEVSDVGKSDENSERRQTRSSRKKMIESKADTGIVARTKKIKKLIYNSDSDSGTETKIKNKDLEHPKNKDFNTENIETKNNNLSKFANEEKNSKKLNAADLDTSFGIDELEMFPDNIVSDPDQINALIADLDDDLNTGKSDTSHNFTKEITLENMMENISSPEKNTLTEIDNESAKILDAIETITNDKAEAHSEKEKKYDLVENLEADVLAEQPKNDQLKLHDKNYTRVEDSIGNTPTQSDAILKKDENQKSVLISTPAVKSNNEDIDSTTEIENNVKPIDDKLLISDQNTDGCSTPDSTINSDEALKLTNEESLPGSTNEVTSTELIDPKPSSSAKESVSGLDSIGNLLSMLQDKSKIKELLSMLGESSGENEKIKKKLEKLSEIVSDDEDSVAVSTADIEKYNVQSSDVNIDSKFQISEENVKTLEEDQLSNENDSKLEDDQLSRDSSKLDDNSKISDIEPDTQETDTEIQNESKPKKKPAKKSRGMKKAKLKLKKPTLITAKRITRATTATKPKVKKPPRELTQLQEDIKEMFIRDEVLSATGIRMCRLAKLVDEKTSTSQSKEESVLPETGPVVVLEKFKNSVDTHVGLKKKKNVGLKLKGKTFNDNIVESARVKTPTPLKSKPGPKSKTKNKKDSDPYEFELDSLGGDTNTEKGSDDGSISSSDSENGSLASSKSFGSTELLADIKKKTKRKRRGWQAGVIKSKVKKKKVEPKEIEPVLTALEDMIFDKNGIPDFNCFTDRNYCFQKNQMSYSCRLCLFSGTDIVLHYRNQHPHVEIPLSRMAPEVAKEAIEQCEEINFKAISKIPSDKYICTFCYKEFSNSKSVLETFFWHIVSMHTGEYKQNCSKCINVNECPFTLDIPPPPKDLKGQLIGFICKKCNFTQISLENLKTHVIVRHNDEQTAVYTINLSVMSKKALNSLLRRSESERPALQTSTFVSEEKNRDSVEKDEGEGVRITRTSAKKANQLITPPIQSKITFEGDDNASELSDLISGTGEASVKIEKMDSENVDGNNEEFSTSDASEIDPPQDDVENQLSKEQLEFSDPQLSSDIFNYPHFKINRTETGSKEYFCCINGKCHFKTTLLISMKKHVQTKHSENWDGYCYVCKVIVTPQGVHRFRDCLQHYLDKHMDSFPIFEKELLSSPETPQLSVGNDTTNSAISKPYINVRPLSELITNTEAVEPPQSASLPIIQSVMSLGTPPVEPSRSNIIYPVVIKEKEVEKIYKFEEHQAEVMSKKYYLVMQSMVVPENLIKIFKCSGRYCSYATGSTQEALAHATTHQRIGGSDALNCCYCNFDSAGNAVDLVMHVFKNHASSQYCCQQCFYRAASSQAVGAHILRVHGTPPAPGSVLRTTATTTLPPLKQTMLTREQAVTYYICGHSEDEGSCKFRTYTADKFCDHLQQRHAAATTHPCHLCSVHASTASELVQHMKSHGVKLYQCTWCVNGADNEAELLAHVSAAHPDRQPQAYIRMITNKDGSTELRVLPLAFLNKHKVPSKDVALIPTKEDPVREAERSIEMEALISPFLAQPTGSLETNETPVPITEIPEEMEFPPDIKPPKDILLPLPVSVTAEVPQIVKPSTQGTQLPVLSVTTEPILQDTQVKTEPVERESCHIPEVVVLDSDDDDAVTITATQQPAIDLSDDETAQTSKGEKQPFKMFPDKLFTCPKCKQVCKNVGGFKKHLNICCAGDRVLKCPHCDHRAENPEKLICHYVADHSNKNVFECGLCGCHLATENAARKHMKNIHKGRHHVTLTPSDKKGVTLITVNTPKKVQTEPPKEKIIPKNTSIKTRFDPQEIDQLPINPILSHQVYCSRCEFGTKVRLNMVRHLQLHAEQQPVPQTAPVNPVPHLETNEKHFDKMVNLASSSVVSRAPDRPRADPAPAVALLMPEAAARYPRYVPERQRLTCGAKGCSYISLDEAMLRCHWETLHSGTSDFHCVHCPPHQHLDTSKPLTATRILSHLKMHDATLYACSSCSYYHFKREALEKHLSEVHKGGRLMVVREESGPPVSSPSTSQNVVAPTMDLKPWQCGLCKFKSMLRGEVIDHCSKLHQSKMQYKCAYCPFRTSAIENISKHQANSHVGKAEEVFYYYYREGSIPDEADGIPRWMTQRSKASSSETDVKVEAEAAPVSQTAPPAVAAPLNIDLNLVKKEVEEQSSPSVETSIEDLCKRFGKFCDPNGIKFKCPLCSVIMEDMKEAMQSHLYEELNYRKWSCGHCSYKAFHKAGLSDHMTSEHRRQYDHIELPTDINIEKWVSAVLAHQAAIIDKYKENLAKQKIIVETAKPGPSTEVIVPKEPASRYSEKDLNVAFGSFGSPNGSMFCCPKCGFLNEDEVTMRDHLEMELNKIRWCCSNCPDNFQTYHEAQFHCKGHGNASRPIEAVRDAAMRAAWLAAALRSQAQRRPRAAPPAAPPARDDSLLVVRYEEHVAAPAPRRKRPAPDGDDDPRERLEPGAKKMPTKKCPYCEYKSPYYGNVKNHIYTHFDLRPFACGYCDFSRHNKGVVTKHITQSHPNKPLKIMMTELPPEAKLPGDVSLVTCLECQKAIPTTETNHHLHNNVRPEFTTDDTVFKCCICLTLCKSMKSLQEHHDTNHIGETINYTLHGLNREPGGMYKCCYCNAKFEHIKECREHHAFAHNTLPFINSLSKAPLVASEGKQQDIAPVVHKRCARKSTTKLPNSVARKSTTKLPYSVARRSSYYEEGYSYYGTKPTPLQEYRNVTTLMSFCNMMMPFSMKQLSEHLNIEPKVLVSDIKTSSV